MLPKLLERRYVAFVLALTALLSACTRPPSSGVNVKSVTADLVFGIPPLPEPVPPPQFADEVFDEPLLEVRTGTKRPAPPPKPVVPCPAADPNTSFPSAAPDKVSGRPSEGKSRWKMDGYGSAEGRGFEFPEFASRSVVAVYDHPDPQNKTDFSFETDERQFSGVVRQTFQVDADLGIFLTKITRDPTSSRPDVFKLNPPVKFLPLPVEFGPKGSINESAVSDNGFDVYRLSGQVVGGRHLVDACGNYISSFKVDAFLEYRYTRVVANPDNPTAPPKYEVVDFVADYDYWIATGMGGLIVQDHLEFPPCPTNDDGTDKRKANGRCDYEGNGMSSYIEFTTTIGQIVPDPL